MTSRPPDGCCHQHSSLPAKQQPSAGRLLSPTFKSPSQTLKRSRKQCPSIDISVRHRAPSGCFASPRKCWLQRQRCTLVSRSSSPELVCAQHKLTQRLNSNPAISARLCPSVFIFFYQTKPALLFHRNVQGASKATS